MQADRAFMRKRIKRLHFVGIGGAGMAGIAQVMHNLGFQITGSDWCPSPLTAHLQTLGITVHLYHDPRWVSLADVVVVSSAIPADNPEILAAHTAHIPVVKRAEMLAELMRFHEAIAVAGTHGKTTTTSLIATLFSEAGLDPTFVIGGLVHQLGGHAKLGQSSHFIVEADESDASFLCLHPTMAVVTNVDADHLEHYGHDPRCLQEAFANFLHRLPFYGLSVICWDDPGARALLSDIKTPVQTFGLQEGADWQAVVHSAEGFRQCFSLRGPGGLYWSDLVLNMAGKHNILNATAAIVIAHEVSIPETVIRRVLADFRGVGRRFEWLGRYTAEKQTGAHYDVIDDYGHHPKEIRVTVDAVREIWPDRRLVMVFQPHRYTRTRDLFEDFVEVLSSVDILVLLEVYAAHEASIPGADGRALARAVRMRGAVEPIFVSNMDGVYDCVQAVLQDEDVVLLQGAGDISALAQRWTTPSALSSSASYEA